ncbi:hypothetical protein LZ554_006757 [Drepanopeziza brunnea f. sp. 'monogermtubi']|nr:hypothetical protein LZ554_006757 [Drepanopeziza brunnea f. sp. 'monogermtubi']
MNAVEYWIGNRRWPEKYFEREDQTTKDLAKDRWFKKYGEPETNALLARMRSSPLYRDGLFQPIFTGYSDQKPRDLRSTSYQDVRYAAILATKGSFMENSELDITAASKILCRTLLEAEQTLPEDSLFHDDLFKETCAMVEDQNEARVVRDILPLIAPPAEILAIRGAKHLKILIDGVNAGWDNSIPITNTRPQPVYSVGFRRKAFTKDQLKRIEPYVEELTEPSSFMATYAMYFPFFTCETKSGAGLLNVADKQNAHSMTMAVRGIVDLFRLVSREEELHRQILAFSISHDHREVRIYGYYPLIDGGETTFYRYPIHQFLITAMEGKEKWTAYRFTKNLYDIWMPQHFKSICSAIDMLESDLDSESSSGSDFESSLESDSESSPESDSESSPESDSESSPESEPGEPGLPPRLESHHLSDCLHRDTIPTQDGDIQSRRDFSQDVTLHDSVSEQTGERVRKRPRMN